MLFTYIAFNRPSLLDTCIRDTMGQAVDYFKGQHGVDTAYIECVDTGEYIDFTDDRY